MWLDSEPVGGCVAEYRAISQIRRDVGSAGFRTRVPSHSKPCYAASWGIACSTNRKNRVLRVPATTDPGDTKSPGSQPPKGGRASFSPRQSTGPRLDRPRGRSDLCRKATTSHVRTSRPTDRFLHGRNGATVDDILGSGD